MGFVVGLRSGIEKWDAGRSGGWCRSIDLILHWLPWLIIYPVVITY